MKMIIFLFSFFLVKIRGIVEILIDNGASKKDVFYVNTFI